MNEYDWEELPSALDSLNFEQRFRDALVKWRHNLIDMDTRMDDLDALRFTWANIAERAAQTGMNSGDKGIQVDTGSVYEYTGGTWAFRYSKFYPLVMSAVTFSGATKHDIVYSNGSTYLPAIVDGSWIKTVNLAIALTETNQIWTFGPIDLGETRLPNGTYPVGMVVYLSDSVGGGFTTTNTGVRVGVSLGSGVLFFRPSNLELGFLTLKGPLVIDTTEGGVRIPVMSTMQRLALTPNNGEIVYDAGLHEYLGYRGGIWDGLGGGGGGMVISEDDPKPNGPVADPGSTEGYHVSAWDHVHGPEPLEEGRGFWGGGLDGSTRINTIDRIDFETESVVQITATLVYGRYALVSINTTSKGFWASGESTASPAYTTSIEALRFSDEAVLAVSGTLSRAMVWGAGMQSATRGYIGGGKSLKVGGGTETIDEIDGFDFSSEAHVVVAATIGRNTYWHEATGSTTRGYWFGGRNGNYAAHIEGLNFNNDTHAAVTASLRNTLGQAASVNEGTMGFLGGGYFDSRIENFIEGFRYADETRFDVGVTIGDRRYASAGVSATQRGYFGGGMWFHTAVGMEVVTGLNYSTTTPYVDIARLSRRLREHAGVSTCGL